MLVVLAGGSFGLAAAAAGVPGQQVRSPAAEHQLDLVHSPTPPMPTPLRPGWHEYEYRLVQM